MMASSIKINGTLLKQCMRIFNSSSEESPDTWSGQETSSTKVGDIFILFRPTKEGILDEPSCELEVSGVALVYREDAFFPMNYLLDESNYEMSFMEGVLSSKASEAKETGLAFYCLRASVLLPLTKALVSALASMEKKYGGSGERSNSLQADPLHFFLTTLGIEIDPIFEKAPIPIGELAQTLWCPSKLGASSKVPRLAQFYSSVDEEEEAAVAAASAPSVQVQTETPSSSPAAAVAATPAAEATSPTAEATSPTAEASPAAEASSSPAAEASSPAAEASSPAAETSSPAAAEPASPAAPSAFLTQQEPVQAKTSEATPAQAEADGTAADAAASDTPAAQADASASTKTQAAASEASAPQALAPATSAMLAAAPDTSAAQAATSNTSASETASPEASTPQVAPDATSAQATAQDISTTQAAAPDTAATPAEASDSSTPQPAAPATTIAQAESTSTVTPAEADNKSAPAEKSIFNSEESDAVWEMLKPRSDKKTSGEIPVPTKETGAESKASEPAASESKTSEPAAESKTSQPASENKVLEPTAESKASEPTAESKAPEPTAESKAPESAAENETSHKTEATQTTEPGEDAPSPQSGATATGGTTAPSTSSDSASDSSSPKDEFQDRPSQSTGESGSVDEGGEQPVRKTMSLQATLERLEEQKQKAYNRLSEFRIGHEAACAQGTAELKEACSHFEQEFNERLKELRKSVMGKLKLLSIEADQKLSILVDEGRGKVEQQTAPAIAELEAAKNQADIDAAFKTLRAAADDFASLYAEKLSHLLDGDPTKTLEERAQKEVGRISYWRSSTLNDFQESGQRLSEKIKSDRALALTSIETVVNRMLDELQRMKELDQTSSTLLESQFNRALNQSKEEAELHLKTLCEKAMATQVLPLLADLKVSIAKSSHEMRNKLAQLLEGESNSSLADFDKLLATAKESMAETSENVVELKAAFDTDGKSKVDELLLHLTSHLDRKLDDFRESFRILEEADPNETPESRLLKRAEHLRSSSLVTLEANIESLDEENKKQAEEIFNSWQAQADATYEAKTKAISEEIATFKTKRRESLAKIEQLLQKHTDSAESIAAEFIQ